MNKIGSKYKLKVLAIVCFILISLSVFIAYTNPAKGYELSIYQSTPSLVWIFLIISIFGGVVLIVHQVYTREYENNSFWLFGFLILILSRMSLLYIPFIRGYYTWRGDNISHIGSLKDILFTGHIANDNFYPITHILLAEIKSITGLSVELVANHSTALFSIFYVISIFLLATSTLKEKGGQLLSVAAIGCVLFDCQDVYIMPNGWSVRYLPLVFFFFFKSNKSWEYKLLLVITLIVYPFFHVLSATVLVISLMIIGSIRSLFIIFGRKNLSLNNILQSFPIIQVLIIVVILFPWILSFRRFNPNIRLLYWSLITGQSSSVLGAMNIKLDKIGIHGVDFVILLIKQMGDNIIFLVLTSVAAIILLKNYKNNKELEKYQNLIILMGITIAIGFLYAAYLFNIIPGLGAIASARLPTYLILLTPIFAGYSYQEFLIRKRAPIIASLSIILIMTASIISIFSLYPSPYITRPNISVTQMDMDGFRWIISYKNEKIGYTDIMSPPHRFIEGVLGTEESKRYRSLKIPDHFNYPNCSTLGESYKEDRYAVITQMDKIIYDTVWKIVGRFNKEDFDRLDNDETVDKLYTNGESDIFYIHHTSSNGK